MLKSLPSFLYKRYIEITRSIAYLPTVIATGFTVTAFFLLYAEQKEWSEQLQESFQWMNINDLQNARAIITTLLGAMISLTVFTFSMVMIVLEQASSRITPNVVGGLISNKSNQAVLGIYIGTIIYCLIILLNISKTQGSSEVPSLAVIFAVIAAISCIILFVKFIHNISRSIQVVKIIEGLYRHTMKHLKVEGKLAEKQSGNHSFNESEFRWIIYPSDQSGYIQAFSEDLIQHAAEHDLIIKIKVKMGTYILKNQPLFYVNKELDDKEWHKLSSYFQFHNDERIEENVLYGFRKITDIIVKALSPAINDPSVAIKGIDHLGALFAAKMEYREKYLYFDEGNNLRLIKSPILLTDIITEVFLSVRTYGKKDAQILYHLLQVLYNLSDIERDKAAFNDMLIEEGKRIIEDARYHIQNPEERKLINKKIKELNKKGNFNFELLD